MPVQGMKAHSCQPASQPGRQAGSAHRRSPSTAQPPHSEALRLQGLRMLQCCAGVSATLHNASSSHKRTAPQIKVRRGLAGSLREACMQAPQQQPTHASYQGPAART